MTGAMHWLAVAAAAAPIALTGCVTVHISDKDGEVRTVRHAGLLQVRLTSPRQSIVGSLSGFGLIGAPLGWSLGYTHQRWAAIGPECRAVVWLDTGGSNTRTYEALAQVAGVCLIDEPATAAGSNRPQAATDSQPTSLKENTP